MTEVLPGVRNVILVLSGKGGVGKSTSCVQLALSLAQQGRKVGLLDVDLCGPSLPKILGAQNLEVLQGDGGWLPVDVAGIKLMSIGFLLKNKDDAVVWRGPKKHAMIGQFLTDVEWGQLDYLLVDTPPGTSDEHMSIVEALRPRAANVGAVLVTTPQNVSVDDVRREVTFCVQAGVRVLGVIENMSGFVCPHCTECTLVFSQGGGEKLAEHANTPFLGRVPIEPRLAQSCDQGQNFVQAFGDSETAKVFGDIAVKVSTALTSAA